MTQDAIDLRGSDKCCPKCGGTDVKANARVQFRNYGPGMAVCRSCSAIWEYWTEGQTWDPTDPVCSFSEPCNNCAFRKGSPEQRDPAKWAEVRGYVKTDQTFYCHKGVPIESGAEYGFAYPQRQVTVMIDGRPVTTDVYDTSKLRICRGWLKARGAQQKKEPTHPTTEVPASTHEANENG